MKFNIGEIYSVGMILPPENVIEITDVVGDSDYGFKIYYKVLDPIGFVPACNMFVSDSDFSRSLVLLPERYEPQLSGSIYDI